ncbi:hypothetical protein JOD24_001463 [Kroppenstedtia sanguinis]|uniref:hypothetical protein n=1 Tax=Kroppenstedtia sanguinis TaxID=1380684 RepID=UPI003D1DEE16
MKRFAILLVFSVLWVFSSGCGLLVDDKEEKEKKPKEEKVDAVEPSETFEEVEFQHINWFMGAPDPEEHGGIWLYNEEKHPGELDNNSWESNDMLLVQASSPKYDKYSLKVKKLQVVKPDVVKIVVKLEEEDDDKPAHEYISLKKGDLDDKKFVVETTDGKPVETK